jgi:hypothetical protein
MLRCVEQRRRRTAATPSRAGERSWCGRHAAPQFAGPTPRRAAVPRGGDAPSPGLWLTGRRAVVLLYRAMDERVCPGRPHPSASRSRSRRGNARRAGPRRRVARSSGIPGIRPSSRGDFLAAGLGRRKPRVERTPTRGPRLAAPPDGRRSSGAAVSRRRAPRVAPSAPPLRAGVWPGLPTRSGTRRRPICSHPSEMRGRRRWTGSSPAQGRAARPRVCLAKRRALGAHAICERVLF